MKVARVELDGRFVKLVPLEIDHHSALCEAGLDPELWRWTISEVRNSRDMLDYIQLALKSEQDGTALPFVTIEKNTLRIVGSTRFMNIDRTHRRMEIGSTWIERQWQRTVVNTEAKYLMLRHAFERLGCLRVEFKTDSLNTRSRTALARIGAREEGIFRNHMVTSSGRIRHSVYFSIIDTEWPEVMAQLERRCQPPTPIADFGLRISD